MKIYDRWVFIIVVITLLYGSQSCMAKEDDYFAAPQNLPGIQVPLTKTEAYILVEAKRGQVLFSKSENEKLHISAACKIMTAILALEKVGLEDRVIAGKSALSNEGAVMLKSGESYLVEDLIYAVILTAANDAAQVLAEYVGKDSKKFVDVMNNKAIALGMKDTNYINATGFYEKDQYTTAKDLSILLQYALKNEVFSSMFCTRAKAWSYQGDTQVLVNSNKLLWSYPMADGGRAGYNQKDKQTLITTATKDGLRLIAVVLDGLEETVYDDTVSLLEQGFSQFKTGLLLRKDQVLTNVKMDKRDVRLISHEDVFYTFPLGESYIKNIEFVVEKNIKFPLSKSKPVGVAKYTLKDMTIIDVNLYPEKDVVINNSNLEKWLEKVKEYKELYFFLLALIIIEFILIIYNLFAFISKQVRKRKDAKKI